MIAAVSPEPSSAHTDHPQSIDEAMLYQLCTLVARGCSIKEAARYVGCALSAIRREREANDRFRRKLARAKMKSNLAPLRAMQRAMLKDWRAAAWFLERTQPEKFGRRNHRAFTQTQANALIKDLTSIVGEELTSGPLIDRISSRIEAAVRYALHAHNDMNRTAAEMGRAMKHHDMKSSRYSPTLADFPSVPPLAPSASGFTRRGENLPPRAPAPTHASSSVTPATPRPTNSSPPPRNTNGSTPQSTPPPSPATPTGHALAQQIVDFIETRQAVPTNTPALPREPNPRSPSSQAP